MSNLDNGAYDCMRGIPPQSTQEDYVTGYGEQYAKEQQDDARTGERHGS